MRRLAELPLLAVCLALVVGCASETYAPDAAPEFQVRRGKTPVYRLGPQQAGPPDAWLAAGERVLLLRREFGFSFAQTPAGFSGYIANDDLEPAPPPPPVPRTEPESMAEQRPPPRDLPIVEEPLPRPDLDERPEDAPAL